MWSAANVAIHNLTSFSLHSHLLMMKSCSTTTVALRKHWRLHRASKASPARSVGSPQAKSMSTIRVLNNVPVHLPEGLSEKQLLSFRPFQVSPPPPPPSFSKSIARQTLLGAVADTLAAMDHDARQVAHPAIRPWPPLPQGPLQPALHHRPVL